jgi:squalene synthase HpnC
VASLTNSRPPARGLAGLRAKERAENFPVALAALPQRFRTHLRAVYDVVRIIDDLGDEAPGDRLAALEAFRLDLDRVWDGREPQHEVLVRLAPTVRECRLDVEPFHRLLAANQADQRIASYPTYAALVQYCELSATPIGRIVLRIFEVDDAAATNLSDSVCTGLQLVEHWQDVAEDRRRGRVYLPQEDLVAFGVTPAQLDVAESSGRLSALIAFETERAAALLAAGPTLVGLLSGWARVAVAGYVAGGLATVDALRRPDVDVLVDAPRPRRVDTVRHLAGLLRGGDR